MYTNMFSCTHGYHLVTTIHLHARWMIMCAIMTYYDNVCNANQGLSTAKPRGCVRWYEDDHINNLVINFSIRKGELAIVWSKFTILLHHQYNYCESSFHCVHMHELVSYNIIINTTRHDVDCGLHGLRRSFCSEDTGASDLNVARIVQKIS